jgi:SAM-dependent methyltransferase
MTASRDAAHFERLYAEAEDPWRFRTSAYEHAKYEATLAALPRRRFRHGLEVGCAIGELTARLAPRCDRLLGIDIAAAPLGAARARCAMAGNAGFRQMAVPAQWPEGEFDLIVLSEILYFLNPADIRATAARVKQTLRPPGTVLLVNYRGPTDDPLSGDDAAAAFIEAARPQLSRSYHHTAPRYRIDVLSRPQ